MCSRSATSHSSTPTAPASTSTARTRRTGDPARSCDFLVDDIHATQQRLTDEGVHFTGAPHVIYTDDATGVEEWMTFFDDGEGNTLALMSRVAPTVEATAD